LSDTADRSAWGWLGVVGPGLLVAATGVGAGDLITAGLAGSELGTAILWAPLAGALLKWVLNEGLARWQLATDTTLLEGWSRHLGRPFRWIFGVYLVLWSFVVGGAMVNACGVAGAALLPLGDEDTARTVWGVVHSLVGLALVRRGGFALFERVMSVAVVLMVTCVFVTAVLVLADAGPGALAPPSVPAGGGPWTLGVLGGVGGTVTLMAYGYWIREHGRRGVSGLATSRLDLAVCYGLTGLFGAAMIVIGSQVPLTASGSRVGVELAAGLGATFGPAGRVVFLLGFWAAVFTSLLGVWQGVPYLFADFLTPDRTPDTRAPSYRRFQIALAVVPLVLLAGTVRTVQLAYTVTGALFMPLLAVTLLILNNRRDLLEPRFRNSAGLNTLLVATLALFVWLGWNTLADALTDTRG
jgi:Mn2+/Fe2+ NRAMP family transporter